MRLFSAVAALFLAALTLVDASATMPTALGNGEVSIVIPTWATWTKTVPVDFDIYRIRDRRSGHDMLGVYVGNNPDFDRRKSTVGTINGVRVFERRSCTRNKCSREALFELPKGSPDAFVHMWYNALSPADAARSDAIIASVKYRG